MPVQQSLALKLPDLAGALQAVHHRHLLVHENDSKIDGISAVALPIARLFELFYCFASMVGDVGLDATVLELPTQDSLIDCAEN